MLTFSEVNEIVKTLPTGYYLGQRIDHELSPDCPASYYDPMKYKIIISYPMLANIVQAESAEEDARCLLYHEVSHAMLTPKNLYQVCADRYDAIHNSNLYAAMYKDKQLDKDIQAGKFNHDGKTICDVYELLSDKFDNLYSNTRVFNDLVNIWEDQRIETLNKDVFLKVNFQAFTKKINDYNPLVQPKDFREFFFHVVRFNDRNPELVKILYDGIYKCAKINAATENWRNLRPAASAFFDILAACVFAWTGIQQSNLQQQQNQQSNSKQGQGQGQNQSANSSEEQSDKDNLEGKMDNDQGQDQQNTQDNLVNGNNPNNKNSQAQSGSGIGSGSPELTEEDIDEIQAQARQQNGFQDEADKSSADKVADLIKKSANKVIHQYDCLPQFNQQAEAIIVRMLKKKSIEAKSLAGYSGRLNPKNVHRLGRVENYRWFDKANPNGLNNTSGKFRINFFCDNSGSFNNNKQKANSIIRCLWQLSKRYKAFEFTLVTHDDEHIVRTDENMGVECSGGTEVTDEIYTIYKNLQKVGQTVWNIVLFDGGVNSAPSEVNYRVWNHNNVIMVCDTDDQKIIEKRCPNAKKIFTKNYCEELEKNLITCMDQMFR